MGVPLAERPWLLVQLAAPSHSSTTPGIHGTLGVRPLCSAHQCPMFHLMSHEGKQFMLFLQQPETIPSKRSRLSFASHRLLLLHHCLAYASPF